MAVANNLLPEGPDLPGAIALPPGEGSLYNRIDPAVRAVRVIGPFLVRGKSSVISVLDGWIVQGAGGYVFGVEDDDFSDAFAVVTHTITASAGANGAIDPTGATSVNDGADQTFTVTPDGGFDVEDVLVDGVPAVLTDGDYVFTNVAADHTIAVTFVAE